MPKPLIGITLGCKFKDQDRWFAISETYVAAVERAGGVAVLLPALLDDEALQGARQRLNGLLLTGGADVDPALYGGGWHPKVYGVDARRDATEIALVRLAAQTGWPFLGICRGIQVINVALGGTLYADLPEQLGSRVAHWSEEMGHLVQIEPDSRLANLVKASEIQVNSYHHQGIERLAPGLRAVGWSPDGLIEAVEVPGHPFGLGVQWHPERRLDSSQHLVLFEALIQAARDGWQG
ncbi:gamma-glutamyl-gamma-aminobutyrate hydrolase family protein [uncultured Thermanaerothrix sp.]|uniref:gamma-glutamyl-gamma-aminobutyrate hydrolase family protein n=1 Tax=uncultured Thermanaerothrix sp. TaxID=1195149 RepID=UPI00262A7E7F|nr:gamma-glutamyl-gamma-aminobutyrate hydrolase family protein [uncultured Thermanaerothrix sp.]